MNYDEYISTNNVLREYNEMKKNPKSGKCCGIYHIKTMKIYCVSCNKNTSNKNSRV